MAAAAHSVPVAADLHHHIAQVVAGCQVQAVIFACGARLVGDAQEIDCGCVDRAVLFERAAVAHIALDGEGAAAWAAQV